MNVGVGDGRRQPVDGQHHHVGVGGAQVVLDQHPLTHPGGGRGQTGMVELQGCRGVDPSHERRHQVTIAVHEPVDGGTLDAVRGELRLESVEGPMGIHHEQLDRVTSATVGRRDCVDVCARHLIPGEVRRAVREGAQPRFVRIIDAPRCDEGSGHVRQRPDQLLMDTPGLRDDIQTRRDAARPLHGPVELSIGDPRGRSFVSQRGPRRRRRLRPRPGRLQQAQEVLGAVIRLQTGVHQRRQEQGSLAQLVDHIPLGRARRPIGTVVPPGRLDIELTTCRHGHFLPQVHVDGKTDTTTPTGANVPPPVTSAWPADELSVRASAAVEADRRSVSVVQLHRCHHAADADPRRRRRQRGETPRIRPIGCGTVVGRRRIRCRDRVDGHLQRPINPAQVVNAPLTPV